MDKQNVPQAAFEALMRGDKLEAIRLVRQASGGDLKGAMDLVQRVAAQAQQSQQSQQQPPRAGAHSGPHQVDETSGQRENRERTQSIMAVRHTPTVMPGDSGGRGPILLLLIVAAIVGIWLFW
jgi:hypothetical protein